MISMIATALSTAGLIAAGSWFLAPHAARRCAERRLRRSCAQSRTLYLTFDDGPGPQFTPRLLDLLHQRQATATFFPVGRSAAQHPALMNRIVDEGHTIGCHTDRHRHAWRCLPGAGRRDIDAGYRSLAPWTGARAPFRPPYGKMTLETWSAILRRGAPLAWWTVDSLDSRATLPSSDGILRQIEQRNGGIILFHDNDRTPEHGAFVLDTVTRLLDTADRLGWSTRSLTATELQGSRSRAA